MPKTRTRLVLMVAVAWLPLMALDASAQRRSDSGAPAAGQAPSRNWHTDEMIAAGRAAVAGHQWAADTLRSTKEQVQWILEMDDQELWDFVPPMTQQRALNVAFNVGCPVHGQEVFRRGGAYPWIMSRERPFKVECPVGGEIYPSNDFLPWHHGGREGQIDTTEPYVDDGTGYVAEDGQHYHFVAHYIFWQRWRRDILDNLSRLRDAYLLSGDERYARKAAVLLARIAQDYPNVDYASQAVHRRIPANIPGGILDYIWENAGVISPMATAYDAVRPALDGNAELQAFLREKGIDDVHELVQGNALWKMLDMITGGRDGEHPVQVVGNFGMYQRSAATLAVVLDNDDPARGLTRDEVLHWIRWGGGELEEALWNRVYRDGHGGESSPGYSIGWAGALASMAEGVDRLGYRLFEHPKMQRMAHAILDMTVLDQWTPSTGDTGSILGSRRGGWTPHILLPAFEAGGDSRLAHALLQTNLQRRGLWHVLPIERIREAAERHEPATATVRHLGGYGRAIAESPGGEVGLTIYYGYAGGGHGHYDRLNIEMFAFNRPILPDLGYPTPLGTIHESPKRFYWTSGTISHYAVVVNRRWQQTLHRGRLNSLIGTPRLQLMDASAGDVAYPGVTSLYRRTSLLIENPGGLPYLVDIYRVEGGWEHVWSFHGPPFEVFETFGLELGPVQEHGTLAGEDVPFGGTPYEPTDVRSGFQYLFNVRRAAAPSAPWGAVWSNPKEDVHLRMTMLPDAAAGIDLSQVRGSGPDGEILPLDLVAFAEARSMDLVMVADAEPELRPDHPQTIPYILAFAGSPRQQDRSMASQFVAVVEPYAAEPALREMKRLERSGAAHGVALAVGHDSGHDIILSHLSRDDRGSVQWNHNQITMHGELAYLMIDDQQLQGACLINTGSFISPWLRIDAMQRLQGQITQVDYLRNTITLDCAVAGAENLIGSIVIIENDAHHTSYEIAAVGREGDRTVLHFDDVPMIVGVGRVREVDAGTRTVSTDTVFDRWRVDGGRHAGRRLLDQSQRHAFPITHFEQQTIGLDADPQDLADAFAPAEPGRPARFWIGDVGAGDRWSIAGVIDLQRQGDSDNPAFRLKTNVPLELVLPGVQADGQWEYQTADGRWQSTPPAEVGTLRIEFSPADLRDGTTVLRRR